MILEILVDQKIVSDIYFGRPFIVVDEYNGEDTIVIKGHPRFGCIRAIKGVEKINNKYVLGLI